MIGLVLLATLAIFANAQPQHVYLQNYVKADTFISMKFASPFGRVGFNPTVAPVTSNTQAVVRMNRDTVYGGGVFDLSHKAVFELPASKGRYMSFYALTEEQYSFALTHADSGHKHRISLYYCPRDQQQFECEAKALADHVLTAWMWGKSWEMFVSDTRYVQTIIRIMINPYDQLDLAEVHYLQGNCTWAQESVGTADVQSWDMVSLTKTRAAIASLAPFLAPGTGLNDYKGKIEDIAHLIGTATLWGGLPKSEAVYQIVFPQLNEGKIVVPKDVPIGASGFWSVSVYNGAGMLEFNTMNSYSVNSFTCKRDEAGQCTIYLTAAKGDHMDNWIWNGFSGWNYMVRLYVPSQEVIDNTWVFPALKTL